MTEHFATDISAILTTLIISNSPFDQRQLYHTAVNSNSNQLAYASLLDQTAEYEKFEDLYGLLDLHCVYNKFAWKALHCMIGSRGSIGLTALNVSNGIVRNRLAQLSSSNDLSGTLMATASLLSGSRSYKYGKSFWAAATCRGIVDRVLRLPEK